MTKDAITHSGLGHPTSINQENESQSYQQANLMEAFSPLMFSLPRWSWFMSRWQRLTNQHTFISNYSSLEQIILSCKSCVHSFQRAEAPCHDILSALLHRGPNFNMNLRKDEAFSSQNAWLSQNHSMNWLDLINPTDTIVPLTPPPCDASTYTKSCAIRPFLSSSQKHSSRLPI